MFSIFYVFGIICRVCSYANRSDKNRLERSENTNRNRRHHLYTMPCHDLCSSIFDYASEASERYETFLVLQPGLIPLQFTSNGSPTVSLLGLRAQASPHFPASHSP